MQLAQSVWHAVVGQILRAGADIVAATAKTPRHQAGIRQLTQSNRQIITAINQIQRLVVEIQLQIQLGVQAEKVIQ